MALLGCTSAARRSCQLCSCQKGSRASCAARSAAKAARALRSDYRLVLTGTPIENRLLDLWSLMNFAMPSTEGPRPSLLTCGDAETYRRIVLINGLGSCLGPIIDAFPLPTYMLSATIPGSSRKLADMLKGGMRCAPIV